MWGQLALASLGTNDTSTKKLLFSPHIVGLDEISVLLFLECGLLDLLVLSIELFLHELNIRLVVGYLELSTSTPLLILKFFASLVNLKSILIPCSRR
jgi:hypothetical protein